MIDLYAKVPVATGWSGQLKRIRATNAGHSFTEYLVLAEPRRFITSDQGRPSPRLLFRAFQYEPEIFEQLLFPQLVVSEDDQLRQRLRLELSRLPESDISLLARHEAEHGNFSFVSECLDELASQTRSKSGETHLEWISHAEAIVEVAALLEDVDPGRVIDFVLRNRDDGDVANMLNVSLLRYAQRKMVFDETDT